MALLRAQTLLAKAYVHGEESDLGVADVRTRIGTLQLARCTSASPLLWPDSKQHVHVQCWFSTDGGSSWLCAGGFGAYGGVQVRRDKSEASYSMNTTPWAIPPGARVKLLWSLLEGTGDFFTIPTFRTFDSG